MVRGLVGWLRRDLNQALTAGAARTPLDPPGGALWLSTWAWSSLAVGLALWLACGYHAGFAALNDAGTAYPDWVWQWLTSIGGEGVPFVLCLFFARRYPRVFWALVLAGLVAVAFSRGLKPLFDAARPPTVLPPDSFHLIGPLHRRASFPSGHATTAAVFFGVLVYYARWSELRVLLVLVAVLVGLSRVAVGVHWPVDVAVGFWGGVLAAWIGARLAARRPALATDAAVHLALVTLCGFAAVGLILGDAEYAQARPLLQALGWAALVNGVLGYLVSPLLRGLAAPRLNRRPEQQPGS